MTEFKDMGPTRATPGDARKSAAFFADAMRAASFAQSQAAAGKLVDSAREGGFRVTRDQANELIGALRRCLDRIDSVENRLQVFDQEPPLGDHDYGKLMSRHMQQAATGPGSVRSAVEKLRVIVETSIEALLHASSQYDEAEATAADALTRGLGNP
ncbi:hypothetical protein [Saccharomonospora saliphila]|uniref:hypothetical protein n=1 Tax=Saccharomonospora saliphila TaxID=369829 RepID=UPI000399A1A1|nr:hypothetical protein [Saccharomonospora saliphila]